MFFQGSLFGALAPAVDTGFAAAVRTDLDARSWVEYVPGWLTGADEVFADLVERLPWRQRRDVVMYDLVLDEPRLTWWWREGDGPEPLPVLADARTVLSARYGERFDSIGCNWYRDGRDSVAWHGDRHRHTVVDPVVAILSVGEPRPFRLRPRGGGDSLVWRLGAGDLLVMGGSCQHDWEHAVPKVRSAGPRISVTYRHGVRDWPDRVGAAVSGRTPSSRRRTP